MDIETKRQELRQYKYYQSSLKEYYRELSMLRKELYDIDTGAIKYDDLPKPTSRTDFTGRVDKLVDLENKYIDNIWKLVSKIQNIKKAIDNLTNANEKKAIHLFYINDLKQWQIARKLYCEERTVRRLLRDGLENIKLS